MRLQRVAIMPDSGEAGNEFTVNTPLRMEFEFWNYLPGAQFNFSMHLYNIEGMCVLASGSPVFHGEIGTVKGVCHVPGNFLNDDSYRVMIMIVDEEATGILEQKDVLVFEVHEDREAEAGAWHGKWPGIVRSAFDWTIESVKGLCL